MPADVASAQDTACVHNSGTSCQSANNIDAAAGTLQSKSHLCEGTRDASNGEPLSQSDLPPVRREARLHAVVARQLQTHLRHILHHVGACASAKLLQQVFRER